MKKLVFVVNQWAGHCDATGIINMTQRHIPDWRCDFRFPETRDELFDACADLAPGQWDAVVLVGGDGTVNGTLPGLLGKRLPVYVFPAGTENDLARSLGSTADWMQLKGLIQRGCHRPMDLVSVNGTPFATVGGIGIGTILTEELNKRRAASSLFKGLTELLDSEINTYVTARTIFLRKDYVHRVRISTPFYSEVMETPAVLVCNQPTVAGLIHAAPEARNDDGEFNVLILRHQGRSDLIRSLVALKRGQEPQGAVRLKADRMSVENLEGSPMTVFGDGEILLRGPSLEFTIAAGALDVFGPDRCARDKETGKGGDQGTRVKSAS